jgi:hypothetical protein
MKKLLFMTMVLVLIAVPAASQDPGDIGLFFDVGGTQTTGTVVSGGVFNLYVVAFDVPGGISAYEGSLAFPPHIDLLFAFFEPADAINFGTPVNWAVGAGSCLPAVGPTLLVRFVLWDPVSDPDPGDDLIFTIGPAIPSSFDPPEIGYVDCNLELLTFGMAVSGGSYPDNTAVGNATFLPPVATEQENWGGVKALFR